MLTLSRQDNLYEIYVLFDVKNHNILTRAKASTSRMLIFVLALWHTYLLKVLTALLDITPTLLDLRQTRRCSQWQLLKKHCECINRRQVWFKTYDFNATEMQSLQAVLYFEHKESINGILNSLIFYVYSGIGKGSIKSAPSINIW